MNKLLYLTVNTFYIITIIIGFGSRGDKNNYLNWNINLSYSWLIVLFNSRDFLLDYVSYEKNELNKKGEEGK